MHKPCNKVKQDTALLFNSTIAQTINEDYADFFTMLEKYTGLDLEDNAFQNIWKIADSLVCEVTIAITIPCIIDQLTQFLVVFAGTLIA